MKPLKLLWVVGFIILNCVSLKSIETSESASNKSLTDSADFSYDKFKIENEIIYEEKDSIVILNDTLEYYYKNFEFDSVITIIDNNFPNLNSTFSFEYSSISLSEIYLNIYKSRNKLDCGINKFMKLLNSAPNKNNIISLADYCFNNKKYNIIDTLYERYKYVYHSDKEDNYDIYDGFMHVLKLKVFIYAEHHNKAKMMELIKYYSASLSINFLGNELFTPYLNDDDFIDLYRLSDTLSQQNIPYHEINENDPQIIKDFTTFIQMTNEFELKRKTSNNWKISHDEELCLIYHYRHNKNKLLNYIETEEKPNVKIRFAKFISNYLDNEVNNRLLEIFDNFKFDGYLEYLDSLKDPVADYDADNWVILMDNLTITKSEKLRNMIINRINCEINLYKKRIEKHIDIFVDYYTLFAYLDSEPIASQIFLDSLQSKDRTTVLYSLDYLTSTVNESTIPFLKDMIINEKDNYWRNKLISYMSKLPYPETVRYFNIINQLFPSDSFYINMCKMRVFHKNQLTSKDFFGECSALNKKIIQFIFNDKCKGKEIYKNHFYYYSQFNAFNIMPYLYYIYENNLLDEFGIIIDKIILRKYNYHESYESGFSYKIRFKEYIPFFKFKKSIDEKEFEDYDRSSYYDN